MKPFLAGVLLFLGASALFGGLYEVASLFTGLWKPGIRGALQIAIIFVMAGGCLLGGAKLWDRWAVALAAILVLLGVGVVQTRPSTEDPTRDRQSARTFQIAGGLCAVAGAAIYLVSRRRRS